MENRLQEFLQIIKSSSDNKSFIKLIISNKKDKQIEYKSIIIKYIELKKGIFLQFVYRYPTKDITKNYTIEEAILLIEEFLTKGFKQADLSVVGYNYFLNQFENDVFKLKSKINNEDQSENFAHDKQKERIITNNNLYLERLGITTKEGQVKASMQDKYKQINKYIEIIDSNISASNLKEGFSVVDMGSGKAYLSFALYDYLNKINNYGADVFGVELRPNLVADCNKIAEECEFEKLKFIESSIKDSEIEKIDVLIALHACDTATDDAIIKGIEMKSELIICAPCCHKQIRKSIKSTTIVSEIYKHGILEERMAETLTDSLRALLLEAYGYSTKVFEFISSEHTPKNNMIIAIKKEEVDEAKTEVVIKMKELMKLFGIKSFYALESL